MEATRMLAVDFGASGGKCFSGVLQDGAFAMEEIHRFAHEGAAFFLPDRNGVIVERTYWDDTFLYQNILTGLREYRRRFGAALDGIGIDTWGADGQFLSADGDLLGKVYAYRDQRLDQMIAAVKARIAADRIYAITGIHFQPFNLSNQLLWFMQNRREALRPGAFFLPIPSLFYYYLGGVRMVDSTWASVTQLMDAKTQKWSAEILKALDIPSGMLPSIVAPGTVVGTLTPAVAAAVGLDASVRLLAVGSHDTASAYAAAPVDRTDEALIISSGTWSLVGKLVPSPITTPAAMAANLSNEGGIGNTRLLKNCMGSWLVQELRRGWRNTDGREMPWDELGVLTARAPAFQSLVDPDDPGFYHPANMQTAIAEFCVRTGQPPPPDRGAFVRTVYESLALTYRRAHEQIAAVSGNPCRVVHIVGGGSKNELLNQFTADALGLAVVAGPVEATAVGNLMVQAQGLGALRTLHDALPIIRKALKTTFIAALLKGRSNYLCTYRLKNA
ncbi:MAG: FGGY-family carbohydrate kinase, partial [bacterium]